MEYETLSTTEKAIKLKGKFQVGNVKPIGVPKSQVLISSSDKQVGLALQTVAMSTVMSDRGTSVAVANKITSVWKMAAQARESLPKLDPISDEIRLVQNFLRTEFSPGFPLIDLLEYGVGVHHSGLSDDARALIEWLAEIGQLRILCATSTISQGLNFPVSSVFLQSRFVSQGPRSVEITPREFWNLVGRAGRIDQDSVGVVGLAQGDNREAVIEFVSKNTGELVSRLESLMQELEEKGKLLDLSGFIWQDQWEDFRCYLAHLWNEKKNLNAMLADSDRLLRQTYGYLSLCSNERNRDLAEALLEATRQYVKELSQMPDGVTSLADSTGFSPEGISKALSALHGVRKSMTASDWYPESLFEEGGSIASLFGVMLDIPQLKANLEDIRGQGNEKARLSNMTCDWVNGADLQSIATKYFFQDDDIDGINALTDACRAIYRGIVNNGTWGISALRQISGIKFDDLPAEERRKLNSISAMVYHGVNTEDAVLMRMNSVPRSIAVELGKLYNNREGNRDERFSVGKAREFLKNLTRHDWESVCPRDASLSGNQYRQIWGVLAGEPDNDFSKTSYGTG